MGFFSAGKVNADYYDKLAKEELQRGNTAAARGRAKAAASCRRTDEARSEQAKKK